MRLAVLVVDDDILIAEETSIGLQLEGYTALTAQSAREALDILSERSDIGVILTDIRMPGQDGLSLASQVLENRAPSDALGVILMTGHAEDVTQEGVAGCIAKPFSMSLMINLVTRTMNHVRAKRLAGVQAALG